MAVLGVLFAGVSGEGDLVVLVFERGSATCKASVGI